MKSDKIKFGISYIDTRSPLHQLNGITKFLIFIAWITVVLTTFDLRIIATMIALGLTLLVFTRVPYAAYRALLIGTLSVLAMNALFMFALAPQQGSELIGTNTPLLSLPLGYTISLETLFYLFVVTLKYFSMFPIALVFVFTTHPTEFAASLNRMGLPYKIAYAVSLTLRYLPEVKSDFVNILHAQQARGLDFSKQAPLLLRLKNVAKVLGPMIFTSLDRADSISNAMTLRGFGLYNTRTWYHAKALTRTDWAVIAAVGVVMITALYKRSIDASLFWYPF